MIACIDCGGPGGGYVPEGLCRKCYADRANNPRNPNFGRTGYCRLAPVDVRERVEVLHTSAHLEAVAKSGVPCNCSRCSSATPWLRPRPWVSEWFMTALGYWWMGDEQRARECLDSIVNALGPLLTRRTAS